MNKEIIIEIMNILEKRRPIFCSEADFQFELSKEIELYFKKKNKKIDVLLEYYQLDSNHNPMYIDILVILDEKWYPIELKYKTKGNYNKKGIENKSLQYEDGIYKFGIKNHGAHNISSYKYLWDIKRIEEVKTMKPKIFERGYAIMLTNDSCYWNLPTDPDCIYYDFSLGINDNDNCTKEKVLIEAKWKREGAVPKRYGYIQLDNKRTISWHEYSSIDENKFENYSSDKSNISTFKYVICEIN